MRSYLLLALSACAPVDGGSPSATTSDPAATCGGTCAEQCGNGIDDDGNGATDCADPACDGGCAEVCTDGRDNDGDGLVDCADADCVTPDCPEDCGDARDNDGDGVVDCSDPDCALDVCAELCADGRDNDGDALVDCVDPDCDGSCDETCDDGRDNDLDGLADCADVDCTLSCDEDCLNGVDDDADGWVDCADDECTSACDADGDTYLDAAHGGTDCDDTEATVHPDADEICDGLDNDCDLAIDDADADLDISTMAKFHPDADLDGFGDAFSSTGWLCTPDPGTVADGTDCVDADADIHPGATEVCNGLDDDCDTLVDDLDPDVDLSTARDWFPDLDGDGFGAGVPVASCYPPPGTVDNDEDCDDADPMLLAPSDFWFDADGDAYGTGATLGVSECLSPVDGYVAVVLGEDCDDADPTIHPSAEETCEDGTDQDCDGADASCCVAPKPSCGSEFYEGDCYVFCTDLQTWADARTVCLDAGLHLVSLDGVDEESWVDSTVDAYNLAAGHGDKYAWIGFNDRALEASWVWDDSSPVTYVNWYAGEPNNVGNEDCATVNRFHPDLGWNDETCVALNVYVCELD